MMLAEAVSETTEGPLRDLQMTEKDRYELKIAGLLHDCGKVTTPVHVVDKATKLEGIHDRIHRLDTRFEILKRDAEIAMLKDGTPEARMRHRERLRQIEEDRMFLRAANIGGERMRDEDVERIRRIAEYRWTDVSGHEAKFLSDDELTNLSIRSGTLTAEERPRIRGRAPRAHGRQGLSQGPYARADVLAGAGHGHRRHLRGAHRQGPAVQEGQDPVGVPRDPGAHEPQRAHRPRPV